MSEFGEEENSDETSWPNEYLNKLFTVLKPLWLKYIKSTHLLPYLPFLRGNFGKITKYERKSPTEATELLFQLLNECKEPRKWQKFAFALKKAKFLSLYNVCRVCEQNEFYSYIEMIELLTLDFAKEDVNVLKLSEGMLKLESLDKNQFDEIKLILQEEGKVAAILQFMACFSTPPQNWIKDIKACLYIADKSDLCKLISEKEFKSDNQCYLEKLVIKNFTKIVERVRPQDIGSGLKPYDLYPSDISKLDSSCQKMEKILSYICDSKCPGKWTSFVNVLSNEGYESLSKTLKDEPVPDDSEEVGKIRTLVPYIASYLDVNHELLSRVKSRLINEQCYQEITKRNKEEGNISAANLLLESIHRFKVNWYHTFLEILREIGQHNVVMKIEPDLCSFGTEDDEKNLQDFKECLKKC